MRLILAIAAALTAWLAAAPAAVAYPQFQLSTGADTCKQCHFSPGGGGLINDYGRDEAGTLSMFEGDGRFLHGAWTPPASFQIGADYRGAFGYRAGVGDGELLAFPMQADLYLRPAVGRVSLNVTVGLRGRARGLEDGGNAEAEPTLLDHVASREHYAMYEADTWYARAGRFQPIYGIRTQDHTAYVRRRLDMYLHDEPYGVGFGRYGEAGELHLSVFTKAPDPELGTADDHGITAYWERRNEDATAAYAAQTRLTMNEDGRRAWFGGVYKRWLEGSKIMFLGELDLGVQKVLRAPDADLLAQVVGYASATYVAKQGLWIGAAVQAYDPDLQHADTSRTAAELNVQWFPYAHVELHVLTRVEAVALDVADPVILVLSQLHYYL